MKFAVLLILSLMFFGLGYSQYITTNSILQRYWNYRYNLVGDRVDPSYADPSGDPYLNWPPGMMVVGSGQGFSIPANFSVPHLGNRYMTSFFPRGGGEIDGLQVNGVNGFGGIQPYQDGILAWGDTWYAMGRYLEVLATEWKLLKNNNGDLAQTENEVYYAMLAVLRLDYTGQQIYDWHPTGPMGFLARDDVPADFCYHNQSAFGNKLWWVTSDWAVPTFECSSDDQYASNTNSRASSAVEMSQDQALQAIEGLYLIHKLIPPGTLITSSTGVTMDIGTVAGDEALTIIKYIRNGPHGEHPNEWKIFRPHDCDVINCLVCRGANVNDYAWPLAMMHRRPKHSFELPSWPEGTLGRMVIF